MSNTPSSSVLFTQVDIGPMNQASLPAAAAPATTELTQLLRDILVAQDRNNAILEQLLEHFTLQQKQRRAELARWQEAHPKLSQRCKEAAESLGKVQNEFLQSLAGEVNESYETMMDGEFALSEFVDRFGPRMVHINGILQMLAHLGNSGEEQAQ